ncbi:hypothetical protein [Paracoccus onubensis]|uniref:hypothetical protein n=1 Tax=Paracoccus onubensis TaxID=1675788 RepID=UPI0011C34402|nr:hypothetical protein [Paracoccus onubensis]
MTLSVISSDLTTLLGHFNVNIAWSDEVAKYLDSYPAAERQALREEFETCLQLDTLGMERFRRSTACNAKDEATARRFFNDVYRYAFEGGEEPYVPDYAVS